MKTPHFISTLLLASAPWLCAEYQPNAPDRPTYPPIANPEAAGRVLAQRVRISPPARDAEFTGVLRILTSDAAPREVPVACTLRLKQTAPGLEAWDAIYRTSPAPSVPAEVLVVRFHAGHSNRYFYATGDAASQPLDALPEVRGQALLTPLAGSDFWLCDLGLEFLHWPDQKVLKTEMRRGQVCRVLESRHPSASSTGYARVLSWVAQPGSDAEGILQAEAYDPQNRQFKEFSLGSFKKVAGQWQLKDMKMANLTTRSRTWLEFDLKQ